MTALMLIALITTASAQSRHASPPLALSSRRAQPAHQVEQAPAVPVESPGRLEPGKCTLGTPPVGWDQFPAAFVVYNYTQEPAIIEINGVRIEVVDSQERTYTVLTTNAGGEVSVLPPAADGGDVRCYGLAPQGARLERWTFVAYRMLLMGTYGGADMRDKVDTIAKVYEKGSVVEDHNPHRDAISMRDFGRVKLAVR